MFPGLSHLFSFFFWFINMTLTILIEIIVPYYYFNQYRILKPIKKFLNLSLMLELTLSQQACE